tara:strand:- start:2233 stop:2364 length:132 start_codon:yes stop_codon:yes gene_type:complete
MTSEVFSVLVGVRDNLAKLYPDNSDLLNNNNNSAASDFPCGKN